MTEPINPGLPPIMLPTDMNVADPSRQHMNMSFDVQDRRREVLDSLRRRAEQARIDSVHAQGDYESAVRLHVAESRTMDQAAKSLLDKREDLKKRLSAAEQTLGTQRGQMEEQGRTIKQLLDDTRALAQKKEAADQAAARAAETSAGRQLALEQAQEELKQAQEALAQKDKALQESGQQVAQLQAEVAKLKAEGGSKMKQVTLGDQAQKQLVKDRLDAKRAQRIAERAKETLEGELKMKDQLLEERAAKIDELMEQLEMQLVQQLGVELAMEQDAVDQAKEKKDDRPPSPPAGGSAPMAVA